ncbi:MAG: hypothetical protein HGA80_09200, partial [Candidatus Omnitrophica bacterium]|nr:hypothetical protein [Candidatus Omnitrophota bacterium]
VPYHIFSKCFLLFLLAVTMLGVYRLTRMLGAGRGLAGLAALYLGISPALLNSTLWMWSEAAAYPWVVWIVVISVNLWRSVLERKAWGDVAGCSLALAVLFFLLTMVKAIAATVMVLFMVPFYLTILYFAFKFQWGRLGRVLLSLGLVLGLMGAAVNGYKWLNWHYNGQYEVTDRGDFALYGNTVRRLQPMNRARVAQALLSVPRLGLCEKYYGQECVFWTYVMSDHIVEQIQVNLDAANMPPAEKAKFFISNAFKLMAQHPFQQTFFMLVESSKMLFWENRLYFVQYPAWLAHLYSRFSLIYTLCFTWALLSLIGVVYALFYIVGWFFRKDRAQEDKNLAVWLFAFWFIACFSGLYSLFFIDMRYALPIAPLFVALFMGCLAGLGRRIRHNVR